MKETFNLENVEDGYYRIKSNGANLHLWVVDGAITEISVHNQTPQVNIFTESKMSKQTKTHDWFKCITLKVKE